MFLELMVFLISTYVIYASGSDSERTVVVKGGLAEKNRCDAGPEVLHPSQYSHGVLYARRFSTSISAIFSISATRHSIRSRTDDKVSPGLWAPQLASTTMGFGFLSCMGFLYNRGTPDVIPVFAACIPSRGI